MRLNLRSILTVPGAKLPFSFEMDLSDLDFFGEKPLKNPVRVKGEVRNMAGALLLTGSASTVLDVICDRCLKPFSEEMEVPVETLVAESVENADSDEGDEIVLLEDGEIDLDEVFETAVVLAMDVKHVCSEDCKGLCPGCGVNLNEEACKCKPEPDPRFAALAQLLDK
ncbi:DUF177 domain-containing protein [Pseudoflavonifractor phocaeensis]|uniref:YceD family protein n=1 Tax=Pseudoflavonifractor phocaeensis TaxID=1870988 RepID=UPI00195ED5EF|nr:DUF177 domain-containing protein [Pseudoflavonifractor phocaeensis]MBM6870862.1 DUF177 domain-containing protein [Pseudoflavonifractor phocaeensis]MBM6937226.1 DUF177 domain-containing protein [Pseudoflavonifractor phocaeensis]